MRKFLIFAVYNFLLITLGVATLYAASTYIEKEMNSLDQSSLLKSSPFEDIIINHVKYTFNTETLSFEVKSLENNSVLNLTLSDSIYGYPVTAIKDKAFYKSNIEYITLGKHIKYIGNNAFKSSINLKELIGFEQIESIGKWAFKDCINLEMDITFKSIQYIGLRAFFNVNKIKSVSIDLNDDSLYQTLVIDKDAFSLPNALSLNTTP